MRILIVCAPHVSLRQPFRGGTESFVVTLANELVKIGHDVDVIAKDTDEQNLFNVIQFYESVFSMKDTAYRSVDEASGQKYYQALQFGAFDTSQYDIIHYNSYMPEMYEIGALHRRPSIVTIHIPPFRKFSVMYKLFLKQTDATPVTVSKRMQKEWKVLLSNTPSVITNGIDISLWKCRQYKVLGHLLWCGRISNEKNPEAAIKIAEYLHVPLKIVGPVFDQEYFNVKVKPHLKDSIEYISEVSRSELNKLASNSSMYIATAVWQEPFGLTTLEMLAMGVPVVGFASAIPKELRNDEVSIAIDTDDWKILAERIKAIGKIDPLSCRAFAKLFSSDKMAKSYVALYENIISKEL